MDAPLWTALQQHNAAGRVSMHMPAHKGAADCLAALSAVLPFDLTELPDTGSLYDGEGATALAEDAAARLFGTAATRLSAGGSTLCIQAMLRLALPAGGKLLCGRVLHRSAANAMALLNIEPIWLLPDGSAGESFPGRIPAETLRCLAALHPDAKAVYLTSPDYFGVMQHIPALAEAAAEFGLPLLIDSAHGAHLHFMQEDFSAAAQGAALAAESAHKTLPVLTGGAWLQIGRADYVPFAREAMALFGSTSPSYLTLLSLDLCREWLRDTGKEALRALVPQVQKIRALLSERGFALPQGVCDPLRIAFAAENAAAVGDSLRTNGIEPEYAAQDKVILIPSCANSAADFVRLADAIHRLPAPQNAPRATPQTLLHVAMTPRCALDSPRELLPLAACEGRIAALPVCPCPPAIPLAMPGEVLDAEALKNAENYGIRRLEVVK